MSTPFEYVAERNERRDPVPIGTHWQPSRTTQWSVAEYRARMPEPSADAERIQAALTADDGGFMPRLFWRGLAAIVVLLAVCAVMGIETAP